MAATPHGAKLSKGLAPQGLKLKGGFTGDALQSCGASLVKGKTMEKFILSVAANTALHEAMTKRGSRKGQLLKSAPPAGTAAHAAWQGAMLHCNPYRASFSGVMFLTPENRTIYDEVEAFFENMPRHAREKLSGQY